MKLYETISSTYGLISQPITVTGWLNLYSLTFFHRENAKDRDRKVLYSKTLSESLSLDAADEKSPLVIKDKTTKMTEADLTFSGNNVSLAMTLWRTFWFDMIQSQLWRLVSEMLKFASPLILGYVFLSLFALQSTLLCGDLY